ncbi:hypothetical protein FHP88_14710 [Sedimenticola selenatireducens]|uniref:Uncharacterized protein n=1 Tax=Sedimenticola selenatireducens TaxID=191960 RepID=A0A557S1N0_9GAMM|nr:hypothetical protein [Sedimenticola selenatireducens]TVO71268.1 hypothetical protein FHP88_14710 [Sedimenticola selenatireducens]
MGKTNDGRQGSEAWTLGSGRLEKAVGVDNARDVLASTKLGRTETWVVTTRRDGVTEIQVLDALGKPVSVGESSLLDLSINYTGAKP